MLFYFYLLLTGLAGGFMAGFLGVGGGIIYILILPIALHHAGIPADEVVQYTIANSIFGTFFASITSTINNIRHSEFFPRDIVVIAIFGVCFSLFMLHFVVNTDFYSALFFNSVVVALLLLMLFNTVRNAHRQEGFQEKEKGKKPLLALTGMVAGSMSSLSGLGGGVIIIPFLNSFVKMDIKKAKTVSLGVIVFTSLFMILLNLNEKPIHPVNIPHVGYIVFQVVLPVVAGVLISSTFGVKVARKIPSRYMSYIFSSFILIVLIRKIYELIHLL